MAPLPLELQARYAPVVAVVSHVAVAVYATWVIAVGLYRSYTELSPSQDTRLRVAKRQKMVPVFAALALSSLATAVYHGAHYAALSYRVWAAQRGVALPGSLLGAASSDVNITSAAPLYVRMWLTEVPIYRDAAELTAETARRFWWGNQQALATMSWSVLLAIEGQRRRIPFLWAYLLLAHLVSVSFAQNLFYLSLLLTPSPLGNGVLSPDSRLSRLLERAFTPKPANWVPRPALLVSVLTVNYAALALLPYVSGSPLFSAGMWTTRLLSLVPVLLPAIAPTSWGRVYSHPHDAYGVVSNIFRYMSVLSVALHGKASISGIFHSLPEPHVHRHSLLMPFSSEERLVWERTTTAVGKVLGSISDHPVVAAAGIDVLLSALSLGLWAAARALDINNILASSVPFYDRIAAKLPRLQDPIAAKSGGYEEDAGSKQEPEQPPIRRRGRSKKSVAPSISAATYTGEDAAITPPSGGRRRRLPRKAATDVDEDPDDKTYVPTPSVARNVAEGDEITEDNEWEAASLAWGLTALGGLGAGSAGVFGAECVSR